MLKFNKNKVFGLNFFLLNKLLKNPLDCLRNLSPLKKGIKRRGSIGITIVMLVFCLLMSVSMSYHKTVQTETMIQNNVSYSDRAIDAAFSGINYAMAVIQSNKKSFNIPSSTERPRAHIYFSYHNTPLTTDLNDTTIESKWINLASTATFNSYLDDDRSTDQQKQHPPYRFKVACTLNSYYSNATTATFYVLIKSYGEYIKYDENNNIVNTYSAQLMAECILDKTTRTIKLNRYRRMQPQSMESTTSGTTPDFFLFQPNYTKDK